MSVPNATVVAAPAASAIVEEAPVEESAATPVPLRELALAYLKLGGTSIGGRSAVYLQDELVHRRHWLTVEDWLEGMSLGLVLPGPVGASCAMFLANLLRGPRAAAMSLTLYVLPGLLIALILAALIFGGARPPWANGAISALSASAFGLFLYTSLRTLPNSRKTRQGPLFVGLAFVAFALLGADLFVVLLGIGLVSLIVNRPRPRGKE